MSSWSPRSVFKCRGLLVRGDVTFVGRKARRRRVTVHAGRFRVFFFLFFFYAPSVDFKNYPAPLPLPPTSYILTILTFCFFFALPTVEMRVHLFPRLCGTKLIR